GKELIAKTVHAASPRSRGSFVAINCGAIPEGLLENELFGHVKGAYTGADRAKDGLLLQANGGTLFLDEIAELAPLLQVKFLRVLQEHEFYPVGGERPTRVDFRLIPPRIRICGARLMPGSFVRISTTAFMLSRFSSPHCASAVRTFPSWPTTFCNASVT